LYDPGQITLPEPPGNEFASMPPHFAKTQEANPDFSMYKEKDGHHCHGFHSHRIDRNELAKNVAVYYGMISLMDKYIGVILDKLDALGLTDDTLVVFTTDHGHYYGHHGLIAKGAFHYDDGIRVPFLARYPGSIPAGSVSDALQSLVDLAPTFLDYAGIPVPRAMTGISQRATWDRGEPSRDHVIVENRHQPTTIHMKTWIDARYKLTVYYNRPYGEIFDLQADPRERVNLWDRPDCQTLRSELLLKFLHAEMGKEPLWMPRVWGA
jgi:arylsulfatase A-like enzyme